MRMKKRGFRERSRPFRRKAKSAPARRNKTAQSARKRPVNLAIDAQILALAKELNINLSQTLEDALRKLTEEERIRRWQAENRDVIESHNAFYERCGTLTEALLKEAGLDLDDPAV